DKGKHLTVNRQKAQKFSEYIGEVPVVLLNPADLNLSQGSPAQRRRFMDVLLSQSSKLYLHHLIQYNRSLKQRNRLLDSELKDWQLIHSWEENLVTHGTEVILKRKETAEQLSEMVSRFYQELSQEVDRVKIIYRSNVPFRTGEDVVEVYRQQFEQKRAQETNYGATMVGPHRDDLLFLINGTIMKDYASQGEHKTFVIALKLAEFRYLQQQRSQSPILLFDDIFGELDSQRIQSMLNQLSQIGQVFVTTTSRNFFDKVRDFDASTHYYFVEEGKIEAIEA
nr:DNA replication and repair protein RecF [Calditrichia bacterium]NIV72209.1 DNA replication and repair protein RecF [Calditrichia bacterium]NIV99128.1 DNA replication and repair protein RecF [Candidatus Saccharibacteria bacterium]